MELFLFLSAIVQNFKITTPPGEDMSLENIDGIFGITHSPKDFRILIQSRKLLLYISGSNQIYKYMLSLMKALGIEHQRDTILGSSLFL